VNKKQHSCITVQYSGCPVHIGNWAFEKLNEALQKRQNKKSGIFILVDENTGKYCLPILLQQIRLLNKAEIIEIESGKSIKT